MAEWLEERKALEERVLPARKKETGFFKSFLTTSGLSEKDLEDLLVQALRKKNALEETNKKTLEEFNSRLQEKHAGKKINVRGFFSHSISLQEQRGMKGKFLVVSTLPTSYGFLSEEELKELVELAKKAHLNLVEKILNLPICRELKVVHLFKES